MTLASTCSGLPEKRVKREKTRKREEESGAGGKHWRVACPLSLSLFNSVSLTRHSKGVEQRKIKLTLSPSLDQVVIN